ncbi:hypothetical protein RRG08_037297 [Elysia crispata]|uniref:Transposase n=1 Tax=Elysia crispata TaxID=231223 RepID=A0AAE1DXV7_9GAST|nr:hypothetical protein RRG08_037297 [Elysia crispata]
MRDFDEPRPEKVRRKQGALKVMHMIFFDMNGVILRWPVPIGTTIAQYYKKVLQDKLRPAIRKKRLGLLESGILFHHDNAPVHTARAVTDVLAGYKWELLEHPRYSPDLAPCDFHLFPKMKEHLRGQRFETEEDIIQATKHNISYFGAVSKQPNIRYFGAVSKQPNIRYFGAVSKQPNIRYFGAVSKQPNIRYFGAVSKQHNISYFGAVSKQPNIRYFGAVSKQPNIRYFGAVSKQHNISYFGAVSKQPNIRYFGDISKQSNIRYFGDVSKQPNISYFGAVSKQHNIRYFGAVSKQHN